VSTDQVPVASAAARSLVSLLGEQRAAIVELLRRDGEASVAELAAHLGISEVATRRHLGVLEDEGLLAARTVRQGRGRPAARYALTEAAGRLFPQRYDRFASEVLDFLTDERGREGLRAFLRWRLEREVAGLRSAVTAEDLPSRLEQLADALSAAGFEATVTPDGHGFTLTQQHCAIADVAREHPEVCAYEAATFSQVLGRDVTLSRRETLANGANACVCCVAPRPGAGGTNRGAGDAVTGTSTAPATKPDQDLPTADHEAPRSSR
jgi:DeoR family transcriptional regulator, suf operon transcriptional repressor